MAKIGIQLTLKQEKQETTFLLCKNDAGFYLKGYSSVSGEKEIALKRNENTKVFELKQNGIFNEDKDTIYSRLLDLTFDWNEIQDDGLELDDELPEGQKAVRYSPDDIYVERRDFTISSIMEYIDDGDLEISPMFQHALDQIIPVFIFGYFQKIIISYNPNLIHYFFVFCMKYKSLYR